MLFLGLMFAFCLPIAVNAALTDNGDGTITDGNGVMWLQSPATTAMTWDEAVAWADALVFAGYDDWRLPSAVIAMTGLPETDYYYYTGALSPEWTPEFPYLYMNEWDNPQGMSGGYGFPLAMTLMPDYWDHYPDNWWCAEEYGSDDACAFLPDWDGGCGQHTLPKNSYCSVTAVRDANGEPPEQKAPSASFTPSLLTAPVSTAIDFDASLSSDLDGTIVLYEWDWESDGTYDDSGMSALAAHAFSTDGMYTVTLKVTDNDGLTDTATEEIIVYYETPNVVPEVPLGTIVISASMIVAVGAYFGLRRSRKVVPPFNT